MSNYVIVGPTTGLVGTAYQYTVVPADGTNYVWSVDGANVVVGQGTAVATIVFLTPGQHTVDLHFTAPSGDIVHIWIVVDTNQGSQPS